MESIDYGALLSSGSIVLGVLTYFLSLVYQSTQTLAETAVPDPTQRDKRKRLRSQIERNLALQNGPLCLGLLALFYLGLPAAIALVRSHRLAIWDFDTLASLFVFLEIGIGTCLGLSLRLIAKMVRKRRLTVP